MSDEEAVYAECRLAQSEGREINDGCARTIGAMYYSTKHGVSFATTGAIIGNPSTLWWELVGTMYDEMNTDDRQMSDMLGTYLTTHGPRPPVAGWSKVWVDR